jgi:hypothetical protein
MKQQQFLDVLKNKNIPFEINDNKITVLGGVVSLLSLTTLPEGVTFSNSGGVNLNSLTDGVKGCGIENRNVRPFVQKGEWRVQIGCFNGNKEQAITAIRKKYGNNSDYESKVIQAFQKFGQ